MKLCDIHENIASIINPSEIVSFLEEIVDSKRGALDDNDSTTIYNYLSEFPAPLLKRVAALLGTSQWTAEDMTAQIVNGDLIGSPEGWGSLATPGEPQEPEDDDDIGEPTSEQLAEIEDGQFRNKPPSIPVVPGPAISQLPPEATEELGNLYPNVLIDYGYAKEHQPFIYANDRLYVGDSNGYHVSSIIERLPPKSEERRRVLNIYRNGEYDKSGNHISGSELPGAVGRIGYNLSAMHQSLARTTIISFASKLGTNHEIIVATVGDLLRGGYVGPDAIISFSGKLATVSEVTKTKMEANAESTRLGELQIALHLGAWPNGRRLTTAERKWIEQQLGIANRPMKKHPMQQAGENAGLLMPGQRWWAPTSESRHTQHQLVNSFHRQLKAVLGQ